MFERFDDAERQCLVVEDFPAWKEIEFLLIKVHPHEANLVREI